MQDESTMTNSRLKWSDQFVASALAEFNRSQQEKLDKLVEELWADMFHLGEKHASRPPSRRAESVGKK